ncbi:hypothetical protein AAC387_Pa08g1488 [Persea americana]
MDLTSQTTFSTIPNNPSPSPLSLSLSPSVPGKTHQRAPCRLHNSRTTRTRKLRDGYGITYLLTDWSLRS